MTILGLTAAGTNTRAQAQFPDWSGQWTRIGGVQWDPSKPGGLAQQAPLTPEYEGVLEANLADLAGGGFGNNPTYTCLPPGMPRVMTLVEPMQVIIRPETTYIRIEYISTFRRIFTDGRDWPATIEPSFAGYSIGAWEDRDADGRYHTLVAETRALKGPRAFDSGGMPLHKDNQTIIKERLSLDAKNPNVLHNQITTIDHALTRPWTVTKSYRRNRRADWIEFVCEEDNHQIVVGNESYFVSAEGYLMPTRKDQPPPDLRFFQNGK